MRQHLIDSLFILYTITSLLVLLLAIVFPLMVGMNDFPLLIGWIIYPLAFIISISHRVVLKYFTKNNVFNYIIK